MAMIGRGAVLGAGLLLAASAAFAQDSSSDPAVDPAATNNPWAAGGYQAIPLPEVDGTLPWETLHNVELVMEGPDMVPEYGAEVRALNGERIKMVGFMLPLDSSGERVLLSEFAPHCPFCMTAGPESFVELVCDDPIAMSLEPIVVEGTLEVRDHIWDGYYYSMADVHLVDQ